jgi:prepilin-type N-terminal cleavage/methylation domain-containing protein
LVGHNLHTPNAKSLVKQSRFCGSFSLSLLAHAQYDALLTQLSMTRSSPPPVKTAFTLIELLVVMATIAILAALAVPAFTKVFESAKAAKDLSNLRQIAAATQMYLNDNNGVFPGSATQTWMSQLEQNQKYLSSWRVLESSFDKRSTSELGDATTAVSYGINANILPGNVPISADKITKPVTFIVFAPAQASGPIVSFAGTGNPSGFPGVAVLANASTPGGNAAGGTHANRRKISAMCADWHTEIMPWSGTGPAFTHTSDLGGDPDAPYRWCPQPPCP